MRAMWPIIHTPLPTTSTTDTDTAAKKRCNTASIRRMRPATLSSVPATAGRKKKWANTMPPTQTMMDNRWTSFNTE